MVPCNSFVEDLTASIESPKSDPLSPRRRVHMRPKRRDKVPAFQIAPSKQRLDTLGFLNVMNYQMLSPSNVSG